MIAELLSVNFYAAGKYTSNLVMFPRSTSTRLQCVVALGPIGFLIVSPNLVVICSLSEVVYSQVWDTVHTCQPETTKNTETFHHPHGPAGS